jgi:hypothetical protein
MEAPSSPIKPISQWKRIAIVSLFGGFGIVLSIAVLIVLVLWYNNRPMQWNVTAIRARYNQSYCFVALEDWYGKKLKTQDSKQVQKTPPAKAQEDHGPWEKYSGTEWITYLGKMTLQISYDLENSTTSDYTLEPPNASSLIPMQKLKPNGTLIDGKGLKWAVAEPMNHLWVTDGKAVLIPALQTVRVSFSMDFDIDDDDSSATSVIDWNDKDKQREFARHLLKDVDAFVLIDETHHYRIELPLHDSFH